MPRKGSRKVRTGCITCKLRKVKCDEARPTCKRCTTTGRVCDGYGPISPHQPASQSLVPLHQPHHVFPNIDTPTEGRALQYFCEAAGPAMTGSVDPYFWTHLVMQLSAFEPAVKHALVSISTLFEQAQARGGPPDVTPALQQRRGDQRQQALYHYNAAIRALKAKDDDSGDKQTVVLVVCVMFICIEALRSDIQTAVRHCRHGIEILKAAGPEHAWIKQYLLPIFRRLSVSAFYFSDDDATFLDIPYLCEPSPRMFSTVYDAQHMFDVIIARQSHLTLIIAEAARRRASGLTNPAQDAAVTEEHRAEQATLSHLLDEWLRLFAELVARIRQEDAASGKRLSAEDQYQKKFMQVFMLTRHESCRIWVDMALDGNTPSSTSRERFLPGFRRVLKQLQWLESQMPESVKAAAQQPPQFMFEMGFAALIFYFVSACPRLEMRLELLRLMEVFGLPRENLWDRDVLIAAGRKIIEAENGVKVADTGRPLTLLSAPRSPDEIGAEGSPSDFTATPTDSAPSPAISASPDRGSSSFVYQKTIRSHPWCSMPWSVQSIPKDTGEFLQDP